MRKVVALVTKLSPRQEAFCLEYAKTSNATQAYISAGYSVKSESVASVNATRLLRNASIKTRLTEIGNETNTPKVLSIQQRKELASNIALDNETSKTDKLKAIDLLNKMDSVYVQRQDVNMSGGVVVLHDDIPAED